VSVALIWSTMIAVAAYLLKNEVLDPLRAFRGARWRVATVLLVHENVLANDDMSTAEAKADIRGLAAEVRALYMQIPFRRLLARLRLVLAESAVAASMSLLIGNSNSNSGDENRDRVKSIRGKRRSYDGLALHGREGRRLGLLQRGHAARRCANVMR